MSGVTGNLLPQAKTTNQQGTIHTENPELLKFLQDNTSENKTSNNLVPRKIPAETGKEVTGEDILGNNKNSHQDTEHFKNINNLLDRRNKNATASEKLKENNSFVSDAGDAIVNFSGREGKENYNFPHIRDHDSVDDSRKEYISNISNEVDIPVVKRGSDSYVDVALKGFLQNQVKLNTVGTLKLVKESNTEVNYSQLSDIAESECGTLSSPSSELARLTSPSRDSLNADFEGSSLPSSPVNLLLRNADRTSKDNTLESDTDSLTAAVGNIRAAGATPYSNSLQLYNISPSRTLHEKIQDNSDRKFYQDNASFSKEIDKSSSVATVTTSPELTLSHEQSIKHKSGEDNAAGSSEGQTTVIKEDIHKLRKENKPRAYTSTSPLAAATVNRVSIVELSATPIHKLRAASRSIRESSERKIDPAFSDLSPRLYSRSSQCASAINSRLVQKHVTDTDLYLEDTLHSRTKVPYQSQRLKSLRDTARRPGSVSIFKDSLDSYEEVEEKTITDILGIEQDSLEISQSCNDKVNSVVDKDCLNQGETTEQSYQKDKSALENNWTLEHNNNKLDENTGDGDQRFDKRTNEGIVILASGEDSVDSQKGITGTDTGKQKRTEKGITGTDTGKQKRTEKGITGTDTGKQKRAVDEKTYFPRNIFDDNATTAPSFDQQEDHLSAPLTISEGTEQEAYEHLEFVIKAHPSREGAYMYHSAQAGRHNTTRRTSETLQASGSNRTTPSIKTLYIESPAFTKDEEQVYRFVNSRLEEDSKEELMDTYRELDIAAVQGQDKFAPGMDGYKRVRYTNIDGVYENRDGQGVGSQQTIQFSPTESRSRPLTRPLQAAQGGHNADFGRQNSDKENRFDEYEDDSINRREYPQQQQQAYLNHPTSIQQQNDAASLEHRRYSHDNTSTQHQTNGNQQGYNVYSNQQRNLHQPQDFTNSSQAGYNPKQGLAYNPQAQYNPHQSLFNQQGLVNQFGFPNSQQGYGGNGLQNQPFPQRQHPTNGSQQPLNIDQHYQRGHQQAMHFNQQQQNSQQHHNSQQQPPFLNHQQQQSNQPQQQSSQPQQHIQQQDSKPPVRGLSLPTGPTYDPVDEEDLKRETSYQQGLRLRIEDGTRKTQQTAIPNPPLNANRNRPQFESADFVQDSLDYDTTEETARSFGDGFVQDSLNMYTTGQQQSQQPLTHFRNPPSLPQNFAGYVTSNNIHSSRLDNVNFDSEDYGDHVDIRQQRVNPQIRPRFYNPHYDQQPQRSIDSDEYLDHEPTDRTIADTRYEVSQRYEDRQHVEDGPMEELYAKPPKYDYVINNKDDLGKQHPKSYIKIHEINKEEKDRLHDIFIQPKPKSKGAILKKKGQDQGSQRLQVTDYQPQNDSYEDISPAEQVWAQRSATLAKRFDGNSRGRRRAPGSLQKFHSDSSLSQTSSQHRRQPFQTTAQQQQVPPDKKAFMTEMPTPVSDGGFQNQPVQLTNHSHQYQTEVMVQPFSQQILTQDGQRISVDVNLKLISPPSMMDGSQPPHQHQPQQYYSGGQGRQYPARATRYADVEGENTREELPALEYHAQDYDSDNNEYRHGSPRERYSADEALRILNESHTQLNPYSKVPPIGRTQDIDHPSSAPVPDQAGSYAELYIKQKVKDNERPWYKVYGLKDYRRMQKEVRLGTLGPDLDSDAVRERREKVARQNDYAKTIMDKNKNELSNRRLSSFPRPNEDNDIISRRKLAIEYAKSVPKPAVKIQANEFNNYELASEKSPIAKHHKHDSSSGGQKNISPRQVWKNNKEMDILDLDKLRQRYEEDKINEAVIRRNTHSTNREGYY